MSTRPLLVLFSLLPAAACDPTGDSKSPADTGDPVGDGDSTEDTDDSDDSGETEDSGDSGDAPLEADWRVLSARRVCVTPDRVYTPSGAGAGLGGGGVAELNKVDLVDDEELLDLVEMEVQELTISFLPPPELTFTLAEGDVREPLSLTHVDNRVSARALTGPVPADGIIVSVEALDDTGARVGRENTIEVLAYSAELRTTEDDPSRFHIRATELVMGPDGPELLIDFSGLDAAAIAEVRVLVNEEPVEAEVLTRSAILWGATPHASCADAPSVQTVSMDLPDTSTWSATVPFGQFDTADGVDALTIDGTDRTLFSLASARSYAMDWPADPEAAVAMVVSGGYTPDDLLPSTLEVAWDGGETWRLPHHHIQATAHFPVSGGDCSSDCTWHLTVGKMSFAFEMVDGTPILLDGGADGSFGWGSSATRAMAVLTDERDGTWTASVTTWAADVDDLPTSAAFRLTEADGTWLAGERTPGDGEGVLSFDQRAVVFLGGASWGEVPAAQRVDGPAALQAAVKLLAVDPESGEEKVATEGILTGVAATDAGGDWSLHAGGRPGDATVARGDILIGGEPIGIERTVGDQPVLTVPPIIQAANGRGNRNTSCNAQQTQQAELL
jgi:hypothetical protein